MKPEDLMEKYKEYSPIENLANLSVPLLIVSGENDTQIPAKINAFALSEKSKAMGLDVNHLHFKNEGHLITNKKNKEKLAQQIAKLIEE